LKSVRSPANSFHEVGNGASRKQRKETDYDIDHCNKSTRYRNQQAARRKNAHRPHRASIWERTTDKGTFHSVSFERRYKDASGNWQTTHSFDTSDLLALAKLADQAHSRILELRNAEDE